MKDILTLENVILKTKFFLRLHLLINKISRAKKYILTFHFIIKRKIRPSRIFQRSIFL